MRPRCCPHIGAEPTPVAARPTFASWSRRLAILIRLTTFRRWSQKLWQRVRGGTAARPAPPRPCSQLARNAPIRSRPSWVSAFSTTADPSGARIASMPVRGSKKENSAAIWRVLHLAHEVGLLQPLRPLRIEAGIALRPGQRRGPMECRPISPLPPPHPMPLRGHAALHRVAVRTVFDAHGSLLLRHAVYCLDPLGLPKRVTFPLPDQGWAVTGRLVTGT